MAAGGAGAALEAATIKTAVAIDAVVAAEGGPADRRALRVGRACLAEGDIAATRLPQSVDRHHSCNRVRRSIAIQRSRRPRSGSSSEDHHWRFHCRRRKRLLPLAAFAGIGALPAEPDGPATPPAVPQTPFVQRSPQQTVSRSHQPPLLWQQFRTPSESIPFEAQTAAPAD